MRIFFLCSSMEPGRDGVGDYTRLLAGALIRKGAQVMVLAFRDKALRGNNPEQSHQLSTAGLPNELGGTLSSKGVIGDELLPISVVRLPYGMRHTARLAAASEFIDNFRPDLISLQYVPYGYSARGLPVRLPAAVRSLTAEVPFHLMVHEVCEGGDAIKSRLRGRIQLYLLQRFLQMESCGVVTTTNPYYARRFSWLCTDIRILPLFGNIPLSTEAAIAQGNRSSSSPGRMRLIYFGAAPEPQRVDRVISDVVDYAKRANRKVDIHLVGNLGPVGNFFLESLQRADPRWISIIERGFLPPLEISRQLASADVGLARVPFEMLGKSGTAIAMIEHGLPLWCPLGGDRDDLCTVFNAEERSRIHQRLDAAVASPRGVPRSRLPEIAELFLAEIAGTVSGISSTPVKSTL